MAFNKTKSLEDSINLVLTGNQSWTGGPLELHLYTYIPPEDPNTVFEGDAVEVSGGDYVPMSIVFDDGPTADGNGGFYVSHLSAVTFPTATANWGTIVGFAIRDTINNIYLYVGEVDTPFAVDNGDDAVFAAGSIVITEK
jgi:hypothetical protein